MREIIESLRHPQERRAFWLTLPLAFPAAAVIGFFVHEKVGASEVALFIVGAMIYVTMARGRLIGSSIMIHEGQHPQIFSIVRRASATLEIPVPVVFVREDLFVPAAALGFGEPYALVLSSRWIKTYKEDELAFVIGRELGHIAAGHTRFLSLLSVNGRENPLIATIFGAWLRRCSLTCDKFGLLVCGSLDAAIRAIAVSEFHSFGREIDYTAFVEQGREIAGDSVLRLGQWLGAEPYATVRIEAMRTFLQSAAYAKAEEYFLRPAASSPPALHEPGQATVSPKDCAGWWRRFAAFAIDAIVVVALIDALGGSVDTESISTRHQPVPSATSSPIPNANANPKHAARTDRSCHVYIDDAGIHVCTVDARQVDVGDSSKTDVVGTVVLSQVLGGFLLGLGFPVYFPLYLALLVIVSGQTFGMLISGLRVVTTDFRKPGAWQTLLRYFIVGLPAIGMVAIAIASLFNRRILLHDALTQTRVVRVERLLTR